MARVNYSGHIAGSRANHGCTNLQLELAAVPAFQSEIVPASARNFIVGSYQLALTFGGLVINSVCRCTSGLQDNRAWRIPIGLFYVVLTIVLRLTFFTPESPRRLLKQGRADEAKANLVKLREGRFTQEQIDLEFRELRARLDFENGLQKAKSVEFVKSLGTINPFNLSLITSTGSIFSVIVCPILTDSVGRRPLLLLGSAIQAIALMTTGGLYHRLKRG
ncbi:sugar transporter [Paraphaeosphaeria sporulosa]